MDLFGFRITRKPSSDDVAKEMLAARVKKHYEANLSKSRKDVAVKKAKARKLEQKMALSHLLVAERYIEQQSNYNKDSARFAQLQAIIVERVEKAEGLGVKVGDDIGRVIRILENGS